MLLTQVFIVGARMETESGSTTEDDEEAKRFGGTSVDPPDQRI